MPLQYGMKKIYQEVGQKLIDSMTSKNIKNVFGSLGVRAVALILHAFDTKGFGNWPDNAASTIRAKHNNPGQNSPLIDTGQLRRAVFYEVVTKT